MDVGEFNGCRLYTGLRLDSRLGLWALTSASHSISAVAALFVYFCWFNRIHLSPYCKCHIYNALMTSTTVMITVSLWIRTSTFCVLKCVKSSDYSCDAFLVFIVCLASAWHASAGFYFLAFLCRYFADICQACVLCAVDDRTGTEPLSGTEDLWPMPGCWTSVWLVQARGEHMCVR